MSDVDVVAGSGCVLVSVEGGGSGPGPWGVAGETSPQTLVFCPSVRLLLRSFRLHVSAQQEGPSCSIFRLFVGPHRNKKHEEFYLLPFNRRKRTFGEKSDTYISLCKNIALTVPDAFCS